MWANSHIWTGSSTNATQYTLTLTQRMDKAPLPCGILLEIQMMVVALCASMHGQLKNICLVCHVWNNEVIHKHGFFHSLWFKNRPNNARDCWQTEHWHCSSIHCQQLSNTITMITLYHWLMDSHCWFLHTHNCVVEVKIIECGIWHWLYCLLSLVQKLLIHHTDIQVCPSLYQLCGHDSQLGTLILDEVMVPFIVKFSPFLLKAFTEQLSRLEWMLKIGCWITSGMQTMV